MKPIGETSGKPAALVRKIGWLGRLAIFLCTFGWAFPHVCTEGMDLTAIQDEQTGGKRRQRLR